MVQKDEEINFENQFNIRDITFVIMLKRETEFII